MALQIGGWSINTIPEVDAAPKALHVSIRPTDYGANGSFALAVPVSTFLGTVAAPNGNMVQFGWQSPAGLCLVRRISFGMAEGNALWTAGVATVKLSVTRFATTPGSGGSGANIPINSLNGYLSNRKRTREAPTSLSDARANTTGIALNPITGQAATQPFGAWVMSVPVTAGSNPFPQLELWKHEPGKHPLILTVAEYLTITFSGPGGGTAAPYCAFEWDEVSTW